MSNIGSGDGDFSRSSCTRRSLLRSAASAIAATVVADGALARQSEKRAGVNSQRECTQRYSPMQSAMGKTAFITGGSSGIGLGIARAFLDAQMHVVIGYRTKEHLKEAMALLGDSNQRVHAVSVDVTDRHGMERAAAETAKRFGKVHVLVNNAGVNAFASPSATTYEDFDWIMNVNVQGVFNGLRAFLPLIRSHGEGGHIVATSSIGGLIASPLAGAYITSKYAVVGLMEALRAEFEDTNIGVSIFCPGAVQSNLADSDRNRPKRRADPSTGSAEEMRRALRTGIDPLQAGQILVRGMINNDLYIFTESGVKSLVRDRTEAILASFPNSDRKESAAPAVATRPSFYAVERDRLICVKNSRVG